VGCAVKLEDGLWIAGVGGGGVYFISAGTILLWP